MTLKNNRAPLLYHIRLCASPCIKAITEFKLELQSRNAQFGSKVKICYFLSLKFDGWPWKTIGHLFYAMLSFVHQFIAIGEIKLELHTVNAQFGSRLVIFLSHVTLELDGWPWKTIGRLVYVASSLVHYLIGIIEFKLELQSVNAQLG